MYVHDQYFCLLLIKALVMLQYIYRGNNCKNCKLLRNKFKTQYKNAFHNSDSTQLSGCLEVPGEK